MSEAPGAPESTRDAKARSRAEKAYRKAQRPWYKKKRFLLPLILVALIILISALSGGGDDAESETVPADGGAQPAETGQDDAAQDEPPAEEPADGSPSPTEAQPTEDAPEPEPEPEDDLTVSQRNAVRSAESYIDMAGFSRAGLIEQLSSEYGDGYPVEDAEAAVGYIEETGGVNWNEEAVQAAESYLEMSGFSREGLIEQLSSEFGEQFTREQAEHAADEVGL